MSKRTFGDGPLRMKLANRRKPSGLRMVFLLVFALAGALAILNNSSAQTLPDAIAIRVVANPAHLSPLRWYNENVSLKGAPQQLLLDGYQAIRDGRTVYVNAANVVASGTVYTNIYIISYSQEARKQTQDIFGQILSHWHFNTNIDEIAGGCSKDAALSCLNDNECANKGYCLSPKSEVVRNTKRLADLADIQTALEKYKKIHGRYPTLSAGSYLPNKTISTWPSWQETLGRELGESLPLDPVNELGACSGFAPTTCWNATTQQFAGSLPDDLSLTVSLPPGSQAYVYRVEGDGSRYRLSQEPAVSW